MHKDNEGETMNFKQHAKMAMEDIVKSHTHNHPLYMPTRIFSELYDEEHSKAAFVLLEQIDTDRLTPDAKIIIRKSYDSAGINSDDIESFMSDPEGFLGDQFRYSVWYMPGLMPPVQLFEDHAYIRKTPSKLTGKIGRDASIDLLRFTPDGIWANISDDKSDNPVAKKSVIIKYNGKVEYLENKVKS